VAAAAKVAGIWASSHGMSSVLASEGLGSYSSGKGAPLMMAAQSSAAMGYACRRSGISPMISLYSIWPAGQPIGAAAARTATTPVSRAPVVVEDVRKISGGVT
jgi:hypothetical protein